MRVCHDYGIPHSTFLDWSIEDRHKAIAYLLEEAIRCQMCGTSDWEWDPNQGGKRLAYEPVEKICWGCYYKARATEEDSSMPGSSVTLVPTSGIEYARSLVNRQRMQMMEE